MALFDWMSESSGPVLQGPGLYLRPPHLSDYREWATLRDGSRDYLQPWEPRWAEDDLTRAAFKRRLSIYQREMEQGTAWPFFIIDSTTHSLTGAITLSNIRRGVADMGTIGYWVGRPYSGEGRGTGAVRTMLNYAFGHLGLHRVEAACVPQNHASRRVLEKAGFRHEGQARAYLKINGAWSDHLLFGVLSSDLDGSGDTAVSI